MPAHIKPTEDGEFRLTRTKQCDKCPWKVSTDPTTIPNGYTKAAHARLRNTIARVPSFVGSTKVMACHEHPLGREVYCVGWLMNQLGPGNNTPMRIRMRGCENIGEVELDGEQHDTFEATLPTSRKRRLKRELT